MKEIKKDIDVVVIFKKIPTTPVTLFKPQFVTVGRLNKETMRFTDVIDQTSYSHLIANGDSEYRYGLRINLKTLREIYGIHELSHLAKVYLKELKQKIYYFGYKEKTNMDSLVFVSEDRKTHALLQESDEDLVELLKRNNPFNDINKLISNIRSNVIGQDDAIEELISVLWRNSKRENKNNILLMGPTGVGKTEIVRTLSRYLTNTPIITVDVSNFTKTGYKGQDVTDILKQAIQECGGDISKVENSIIILDEFDKLAQRGMNDEVTTLGVQQELLKILEDGVYNIELGDGIFNSEQVSINTKGITFILAGAFSDLFEEKPKEKVIGITTQKNVEQVPVIKKKTIAPEELTNFGIIPEAIGRIHHVIVLNSLTKDNFITIMKNPDYHVLKDNIRIFEELGIRVKINENVYSKLAQVALEKKTGARALIGSVESLFSKASLEAKKNIDKMGYNYLEITEDTVLDNSKYILKKVKKKENK